MPSRPKTTHIRGIGFALPHHVVPNETLAKFNGIEPTWIVERTGIQSRFMSNRLEKTSTLATAAAREALQTSGADPGEIDLLILATSFPDSHLPLSTAGVVKDRLRLTRAVAFDLHTPAVGYVLALQIAAQYLDAAGQQVRNALVIGAECFSTISDLRDRRTCYLFGDGAGAMLLSSRTGFATLSRPIVESRGPGAESNASAELPELTDSSYSLSLYHQPTERLQDGIEVTWGQLLAAEGLAAQDVKFLLTQQMQSAAIERATAGLALAPGVLFPDLLHSANLLAATLPVAFCRLARSRKAVRGDRAALIGTDGRSLWGGAVVRFTGEVPVPEGAHWPSERSADMPERREEPVRARSASFRGGTELVNLLAQEVEKAKTFGSQLSTIVINVGHSSRLNRSTVEQMARETRLIFSRQVRCQDVVVELEPGRFAVILPNQDATDARRIAERLKRLLEGLDPVEEIEIQARYVTLTFNPGGPADDYVGEVVRSTARVEA